MISETAIDELDAMIEEGLSPTPRDIVKLNALGLKLEAKQRRHATDSTDYLPRVAVIDDETSFRQPSIGHDIWFDRVERVLDIKDIDTKIAVNAFALSRPAADLPDGDDPKAVMDAVKEFSKRIERYTRDQIEAALDYAFYGADSTLGETVKRPDPEDKGVDAGEGQDWSRSVAAGVLYEGQVALYGVSVAELREMTQRQVRDLIRRSYMYHHFETNEDVTNAQGDFLTALNEIRARLTKEREDKETSNG